VGTPLDQPAFAEAMTLFAVTLRGIVSTLDPYRAAVDGVLHVSFASTHGDMAQFRSR